MKPKHPLSLFCAGTLILSGCAALQQQSATSSTTAVPYLQQPDRKHNATVTTTDAELQDTNPAAQWHTLAQLTQSLQFNAGIAQALYLENPQISRWQQLEPATLPAFNLWDRLRQSFQFDLSISNPRVDAQFNWYRRHPSYLSRVSERARRYLYHVVEEIEARGMPGEFALLPVVESAYDPFAYSHGRASGMWQFIPGTGRHYGLQQNWWYDGRRDIVESTRAALDYLEHLHRRFDGDWLLALAAYNSGGGTVNKAMRNNRKRGKPTHFWALDLPKETRAYVPKLIALGKLIASPQNYGISLNNIPNEPYFTAVDVGSQIDLAQAARLAGISVDELYMLNPGFSQWATAPEGPHNLLLPATQVDTFTTNLAELPAEKRVGWRRYEIKRGDSLISIASKFNTTPQLIRETNQLNDNLIRAGKKLLIPIATKNSRHYTLSANQRLKKKQNRDRSHTGATRIEYKVQSGDSFWELARKHKVSVRKLAGWNGMAPNDPLMPGKKLVIWSKAGNATLLASSQSRGRSVVRKVGYRVRSGDNLYTIASRFNVSVRQISRWNKINPSNYLQPGQRLVLYVNVTGSR